jgi:hypothetical protein
MKAKPKSGMSASRIPLVRHPGYEADFLYILRDLRGSARYRLFFASLGSPGEIP